MANEISGAFQIQVANGGYNATRQYNFNTDQSAVARGATGIIQNIPTTAGGTAIAFPTTVATRGFAWFINLDTTNYVTIGVQVAGTFYPLIRLKGNATASKREAAFLRLEPGVTVYALANTGAVDIEFGVLND